MSTSTVTSTSASSSTTAALAGTGSTIGATSAQEAQDRFLKLLVAQMNNQDPMNPLDNAQMTTQIAQINTVTGIQQLNETVNQLLGQFSTSSLMQGASLVGRDVLSDGNALQLSEGSGRGAVELGSAADSVQVEVLTRSGATVATQSLGSLPAGRHAFEVDVSAYSGTEALEFRVTALRNGQATAAVPLQRSRVEGVSLDDGQLTLQLQGRGNLAYGDVRAVL